MGFCLLGMDVANEVRIGDFAILMDPVFCGAKYGAGAFDSLGDWAFDANAIGKESAAFVGKSIRPN